MSTCLFCNSPLNDEDARAGKCSNCGRPLDAVAEDEPSKVDDSENLVEPDPPARGEKTAGKRVVDQTVKLDGSQNAPPDPAGSAQGSDSAVDQTIDSTTFPAPNRKTVTERVDQTVDLTGSSSGPAESGDAPPGKDTAVDQTIDSTTFPVPGKKTVPERVDQTVDFGSSPAESGDASPGGDSAIDQTIDSTTLSAEGVTKPDTVSEREHARTIAAESVPLDVVSRISESWHVPKGEKSNPLMTIKGRVQTREAETTLVVHERALRRATDQDVGNADYELLDKLGEGGMGYVYLARQAAINRIVALKMLKTDTSADSEQRFKFLSEAVVTGDLDHPNIVPIYDLGTNEQGAPFYSMKRVQGTPWMNVIGKKSLQENVEILMKVADAVAFAHSRGVVHRDLKPENVMLGEFGEVLLLDWGLALPTTDFGKSESVTQTNSMGGTPAYMSPEMATGPVEQVGTSADVYLLGAILYEIVNGKPPHAGKDVMKCLIAAAKNEIQPTEKSGELLDIAIKAMSTRTADRYGSVREFQDAIRMYMSHTESIALSARAAEELNEARETDDYQDYARALFGFAEAYALWDRNERAKAGQAEASLAYAESALQKGDFDLGASLLDESEPQHADVFGRIKAAQLERDMRQQRLRRLRLVTRVGAMLFLVVVTGASVWIWHEGNKARQAEQVAVEEKVKADGAREKAVASEQVAKDEKKKADDAREKAVASEQVAKDEKKKADVARDEAVEAKDEADRQRDLAAYQAYIALIGLADAKIEENAFGTARQLLDQCSSELRHWEWGRLRHMCQLNVRDFDAGSPVEALAFSRRGQFITGGWNGLARIWNAENGELIRTLNHGDLNFVRAVALSPDGKWAATGTNDAQGGFLRIWDAERGELLKKLDGHTEEVVSLAFSGDGSRLLSGSFDHTAKLWEVESGRLLRTFRGHRDWVWSAAFCYQCDGEGNPLPEGKIVTASQDGFAIVWRFDEKTGDLIEQSPPFRGHQGPVYAAAFSPDGQTVATGGNDTRILLWKPSELRNFEFANVIHNESLAPDKQDERKPVSPPQYRALAGHTAAVRCLAFDRKGQRLVSGGHDNTVRVWDAARGISLKTLRGHDSWVRGCAFSPVDEWVLSASYDRQAKRWDVESYEEVRRVPRGRILEGHSGDILAAAFSGDGKYVVTASRDRTAKMWDAGSGAEVVNFEEGHAFLASQAIFFSDGKRLITGAVDNTARIWDITTGTELARLDETGRNAAVAVSRDGKWILTGSNENTAKLWEFVVSTDEEANIVHQAQLRAQLDGHNVSVTAVAFSQDTRLIYSGDSNGRGRLWDASNKEDVQILGDLRGHTARITSAEFLPNGKRVLTASGDGTVGQWDVATCSELPDLILKHERGASVTSLALTPDGRNVLSCCDDGKVRFWDVDRAEVLRELKPAVPIQDSPDKSGGVVQAVTVSFDGKLAATVNPDAQAVRLFNLETGKEVSFKVDGAANEPFIDFSDRGLVWSAAFAPDGRQLATVGGDNARLWDVYLDEPPKRESQVFIPHGSVASARFSPDGKRVLTSSWDNSARIWNARTGRCVLKLEGHGGAVNSAVFSPDGTQVLTASSDRTARLWDAATGNFLKVFSGHEQPVNSAEFSPDGSRIVTASDDATARIWEVASKSEIKKLQGHVYGVLCATFSSDGKLVMTGGEDNTAKIWNVDTAREAMLLEGHTASVTSVAFSPDDKRALTGSEDFTAKLWDATPRAVDRPDESANGDAENATIDGPQAGKEILTLKGHDNEITAVSFSRDGIFALTGSRDGTAIIWLADRQWNEPDLATR